MFVREAELADLDALLWPGEHVRANRREKLDRHARGESVVLVASVEGEIVGHLEVHLNLPVGAAGVQLAWLEVRDEFRGRGVGGALLHAAERVAIVRGREFAEVEVEKSNVRALALYERFDFEVVSERVATWVADLPDGSTEEVVWDLWILRKSLGES